MRFVLGLLQILLLAGGVATVVYHEQIIEEYDKQFGEKDDRQLVAEVLSSSGNVRYKLPKTLIYKKVRKDLGLKLRDTITTDAGANAKLRFSDGLELEIGENSFLVLDQNEESSAKGIKISFLRGNFKVLKRGKAGKTTLIKNTSKVKQDIVIDPSADKTAKPIVIRSKQSEGFKNLLAEKQNEAAQKQNVPEEMNEAPQMNEKTAMVDPVAPKAVNSNLKSKELERKEKKAVIKKSVFELREEKETLPESYIVEIIKKQKPFFNRCYAQHLRLNPEAEGRIDFSFTINPKGEVIDVRVLRATINDPRLHRCSSNVIERAKFKAFNG
ncbi:MAG: AgmX/PglI C-terminal domain-containing protein, partial [Bdellovibrionota bacterium]|nr:AgmX/PglI C-terminal domain-containing protein [Bdellovibrionota bacterium]